MLHRRSAWESDGGCCCCPLSVLSLSLCWRSLRVCADQLNQATKVGAGVTRSNFYAQSCSRTVGQAGRQQQLRLRSFSISFDLNFAARASGSFIQSLTHSHTHSVSQSFSHWDDFSPAAVEKVVKSLQSIRWCCCCCCFTFVTEFVAACSSFPWMSEIGRNRFVCMCMCVCACVALPLNKVGHNSKTSFALGAPFREG